MKEVKLNEFITLGNKVYKCINDYDADHGSPCSSCDLQNTYGCHEVFCSPCTENQIESQVIFVLYDTIPDEELDYEIPS